MQHWEQILADREYSFTAQVDSFVRGTQLRMDALVRSSVQDVIRDAQRSVGEGGRMRIDTGFLRASGQLSLSGTPSGPVRPERHEPGSYPYQPAVAELALAGATVGSTIYFGWTAAYAKYREAYDGFLYAAVQNWQQIVNRNARRIRQASPSGGIGGDGGAR